MKSQSRIIIILALLAFTLGACARFDDVDSTPTKTINYTTLPVEIKSGSRNATTTADTRLEVGDITSGQVNYNWSDNDSIGVFLLNVQPKHVNNSVKGIIDKSAPRYADFSFNAEFVTPNNQDSDIEGYNGPLDMFVYYPYNSSLVIAKTYDSGTDSGEPYYGHEYLHSALGLVYRVPALQTILEDEVGRQGCTKAMSRYGICYDFLRYEDNSGQFDMRHENAYLRVRVTGSQHASGGIDFGNGNYFLKKVIVKATYIDENGEEKNANIAGTYHMGYDYVANGSYIGGDESLTPINTGGITHVSSELHTQLQLKPHNNIKDGSADDAGVYVLLTINPREFEAKNVSRLYFTAEITTHHGENESSMESLTRSLKVSSNSIKAGGLYDISFNAQEPIDEITHLDSEDSANTYIVTSPGTYCFSANSPGNGVLPANVTTFEELGFSENLIDDNLFYGVDWLWASGDMFEGAAAVEDVCSFEYDDSNKTIKFTLAEGYYNATGNVVLALYQKAGANDDSVKEIVWTWHLWFAEPKNLHFRFANTRESIALNNEEWHMLDRNLGAEAADLSYKAIGCYYQVGRKDPFIGPNTLGYCVSGNTLTWSDNRITTFTNTERFGALAEWKSGITDASGTGYTDVETYRHKYPMWIIDRDFSHAHLERNKYAWVHRSGEADFNTKTLFDPCPPGYKLPTTREWDNFKNNEYEYTHPAAYSSGPFGYSMWNEAVASSYSTATKNGAYTYPETAAAWEALNERLAAGDYYEVDSYNGRRYHIRAQSAHGDEIIASFPTTGALNQNGNFVSLGYNFALWAAGRIENLGNGETRYDAYWFGIKNRGDFAYWGDWYDWNVYSPYTENMQTYPIGAYANGIGEPRMTTDNTGHHSALGTASNYAVPVRCIRQYNTIATD